jgi:hypothetical protein
MEPADLIREDIIKPIITIFKGDVEEWVDIVAKELAEAIYERNKDWKYYDDLKSDVIKLTNGVIRSIEDKIGKLWWIRYVEGRFGFGEREFTSITPSTLIRELRGELQDRTFNYLLEGVKTGKGIEKPEKSSEDTDFEYTLNWPIPSVPITVLKGWNYLFSREMVKKLNKLGLEGKAAESKAREIITYQVDKTVVELEKKGSDYVNIIKVKENDETCELIPVLDFIGRIYKAGYNKTMELFNKTQSGKE